MGVSRCDTSLPSRSAKRWVNAMMLVLLVFLLQACGQIPSNYSYERIPEEYELVRKPAEVIEVDNCESDLAVERSVSQSTHLSETVVLDQEQINSIALQPGVSAELGLGVGSGTVGGGASVGARLQAEIKSEVARRFGAGLDSGQSRTESITVYVNPHRKAIVTLEWVETWEIGKFVILRDGAPLGSVSYSLLKDIRLDSRVRAINCGWSGKLVQKAETIWIQAKSSWPLQHLEITLPIIGILTVIVVLVLRRVR